MVLVAKLKATQKHWFFLIFVTCAFFCPRSAHSGFVKDSLNKCGALLKIFAADPFTTRTGWFTPQFKSKGDAERWLYSMVPRNLDAAEHDLLMAWPRQGHSIRTNQILRANQLDTRKDEIVIPGAFLKNEEQGFSVRRTLDVFNGVFRRSRSDRAVTAYRAVGKNQFGHEPEVGNIIRDPGLMNVSLEYETVKIHGNHRALKEDGQVQLILNIPRDYPLVPTLAHHPYKDSTGHENIVSVELELTLPPNTSFRIVNKFVNSEGVLTLEAVVDPQ